MTSIATALRYIKEHEDEITPLMFVESFRDANGLWDQLLAKGYATIEDGKVRLTTIGEKML